MSHFILAVDVGNSRIKFGLFDRDVKTAAGGLPVCLRASAVGINERLPWEAIRAWQEMMDAESVAGVVAGANPAGVNRVLENWEPSWSTPRVIERSSGIRIQIDLEAPEKIGIDRLLNAVAANVIRPEGRPAVIVDSGTATTVDLVDADGAFAGGAILPGFELAARSLHRYTALLPYISIEELAARSHPPVGKNTQEAITSGLFWGHLGAVRELVSRMAGDEALVLLTGGGAPLLAGQLADVRLESHLALQGLVLAYSSLR